MITIVKGDDFEQSVVVKLDGVIMTSEDITSVYFSSASLNVTKVLPYNSTKKAFILSLTKQETAQYSVGKHKFDITMDTTGNKRKTVVYNDVLDVLIKTNTVVVN